jgi:hypothetical protein
MKGSIFLDVTRCTPLKVKRRFGGIFRLHFQGRIFEATEETSVKKVAVDFQRNTRRYIPEHLL